MLNYEISEQITRYHDHFSGLEDAGLWKNEIDTLIKELESEFTSVDDWMGILNHAQIVDTILTAGLEHSEEFRSDYDELTNPTWEEFVTPPVDEALQDSLVNKVYPSNPKSGDKYAIIIGDYSRYVGAKIVEHALKDGTLGPVSINNPNFSRLIYRHVDEDGLDRMAENYINSFEDVTWRLSSTSILPDYDLIEADNAKTAAFAAKTREIHEKTLAGDIMFTLTKIPSRKDAEVDGMNYDDYVKLFFEMCDQPWDHIDKAHQKLIDKLNNTTQIQFKNNDGTDLTMELVDEDGEPFTFCNSLIAKNVPGSEVFSAPRIDSVNGTIVAEGRFNFTAGKIIENLTMHFKDGYLESFEADKGAEHFQEFLDRNPGNRQIGELGIGTNPHLKQHVLNGLLVEKIGGSFHVALGRAYTMTEYAGVPVKVDNGNNDTNDHWDITTMLYGKEGTIIADGEVIMENGRFIDPDLAVLNEGWAAVPISERPEYWKDFKGYGNNEGGSFDTGGPNSPFFSPS